MWPRYAAAYIAAKFRQSKTRFIMRESGTGQSGGERIG
jgi:hypothetical protein